MINMRKIAIIILLSLLLPICESLAQENKRVEVTTIYRPEVASAKKLLAPTTITDTPSLDVEVEYDIKPETWSIELQDDNFKAATATFWDYNRSRRGYMKLSAGAPLGSDFQLRYATQNSRVGYFGVNLCHDGGFTSQDNSRGVVRPISQSYDMRNGLALFGGAYIGRQMFEASLNADYDIYNRYAELTEIPTRQHFGRSGVTLRYGDDFSNMQRVNFAVELHSDYWMYMPAILSDVQNRVGEYNLGAAVEVGRDFGANGVGINFGYDMWGGNANLERKDMRFNVGVDYSRTFGIFDLAVGLEYMYDKVAGREKGSHFVLPHLKMLVDLKKAAFAPYLEFDSNVSYNGAASLYASNPYLDYGLMANSFVSLPNTLNYDLTVGFTGVLDQSRFSYRAYVGGRYIQNELFWYVPTPGVFAASTANDMRLVLGAELQYRPVSGLLIGAGIHYRYDKSESEYVVSEPNFMADAIVEYKIKKFKFYVMSDIFGRREWSDLSSESGVFATPVKVDLHAGVSFVVNSKCEIFVDGYNLLNRTGATAIYDYAYYYRNGIGCMAGVKLSF